MMDRPQPGENNNPPPQTRRRDLAHLIKWILLILLVILLIFQLASGEADRLSEGLNFAWFILLIKLILIGILILLMWVQRDLKCELTEPAGCIPEEPDPIAGRLFVKVIGTAGGAAFSHYTLDIRKDGDPPYPGVVSYPGGGGSGSTAVSGGLLGEITTTSLMDGAYEIILTVYPVGSGSPKTCTITFNLLKAVVYIARVANVPAISAVPMLGNSNPFDPLAELRLDVAPSYPMRSFGGKMSMEGAAYIYECAARKIKKYEIRYTRTTTPGGEPGQPAMDAPIPPAFTNVVSPLPLEYVDSTYYQPWTRVGIAPTDLINSWKNFTIGGTTFHKLRKHNWNSGSISGRYSLLLTAEDTAGHLYHDIQHIWLDNHPIVGRMVKFQWYNDQTASWEDIPKCEDLSMKKFGKIRIMGLAWDPVIDEAWWPAVSPNDNFGHFNLKFWKQFGSVQNLTGNINNRVPALPAAPPVPVPTDADAGELAIWDITTLDAGTAPSPYVPPPDPKIYRNESCTYTLRLYVTDTTILNEGDTHEIWDFESVKIVNDLD